MISASLFRQIERSFPLPSIDIVVLKDDKVILTKRVISPYKGFWHLPGSIIRRNEKMVDAVRRASREELGIQVRNIKLVNCYELFTANRHYVTHLFTAAYSRGEIKLDFQSSEVRLCDPDRIPTHTIPLQKRMIVDAMKSTNAG